MTTLARLSFWVPAARLSDFEAEYRKKLLPLLERHELVESAERSRSTVEGVFSRLFEVGAPAAVIAKRVALQEDPAWQEGLVKLGKALGITAAEGPIRCKFGVYQAPTGARQGRGGRSGVPAETVADPGGPGRPFLSSRVRSAAGPAG